MQLDFCYQQNKNIWILSDEIIFWVILLLSESTIDFYDEFHLEPMCPQHPSAEVQIHSSRIYWAEVK